MLEEEQNGDPQSEWLSPASEGKQFNESLPTPRSNILLDTHSFITDDKHEVTFTVTVAIAVASEPEEQSQLKDALSKQMIETPRAQNYYHLEYSLLPEDEAMKTDVVTYGVACKIYTEKYEAKVIKTWQTGDVTWFAWAHSHTVAVSKQLLLKMFNHTVELRLWNTKDKCSTRARFDRPKAFRLPQPKPGEKPEDIGGVKTMVTKLLKEFKSMQPKKATLGRSLPTTVSSTMFDGKSQVQETGSNTSDLSTKLAKSLAAVKEARNKHPSETQKLLDPGLKSKKPKVGEKAKTIATKEDKEVKKQVSEHTRVLADKVKKLGLCAIPLRLALLFGDRRSVVSRLESPAPGIEDMFLNVSISCPLLSVFQEEDLNPMSIQICSVTKLPSSPVPLDDLKLKCQPVYCKYKFFKEPEHTTPGKGHNTNIYYGDTNIVLLGAIESSQLNEFLNGPRLEIEVHDRDRKPDRVRLKPTLFGDDLEDEKISNVGTVESRRTLYNPFHERDRPWDPYGVAKVDLSELLLGGRFLELKVPVLNCPIPDILGTVPNATGKLVGISGAVDGPVDRPISAGHYIQSSTMLKVKIQLAHPLNLPSKLMAKEYLESSIECPFNRIIFIFDYYNLELLQDLQTLIMGFNAKALSLDGMPQHVIDSALSTYKLSIVQQCSLDLDIITGFHILDGIKHIFVLEGLRTKAISVLWDTLPQPKETDVTVLYNSDLSFSKRLYGLLDVDLCRVKLHEPLSAIVQQPLLYVRDMVFRPCYDALIKLDQITKMNKMRSVVRNDLFPTSEMVMSLSREFGVPFTQEDFEELRFSTYDETMEQDGPIAEPSYCEIRYKPCDPVDNYNGPFEEHLMREKVAVPKDYISMNIENVQRKSDNVSAERKGNKKCYITADADPVYNYSIQFLNSSGLATDYLRRYLREKDPRTLYAYNQEFMSGLFCPVSIEQEEQKAAAASRARWKTAKGWTSSEKKSIMQSHAHPHYPDSARLDELREEWPENALHTNTGQPPLDRGHYPWCDRKKDFDLYTRPEPDFGQGLLFSICVSGNEKQQEAANLKGCDDRHSLAPELRQYFHRVLPATELLMKGFHSSNQLDRLKGLLKDPIRKHGLGCGANVNDIPALAVVNNPGLDVSANRSVTPSQHAEHQHTHPRFCGLQPGDFSHSWTSDDNQVPCHDYEHGRFKHLKGYDFSAYHRSRDKLSLRPIMALRPEERNNHLFRTPFSAGPYTRPLPPLTQRLQNGQALQNLNQRGQASDGAPCLPEAVRPVEDIEATKQLGKMEAGDVDNSQLVPEPKLEHSQQHIPVMA